MKLGYFGQKVTNNDNSIVCYYVCLLMRRNCHECYRCL